MRELVFDIPSSYSTIEIHLTCITPPVFLCLSLGRVDNLSEDSPEGELRTPNFNYSENKSHL